MLTRLHTYSSRLAVLGFMVPSEPSVVPVAPHAGMQPEAPPLQAADRLRSECRLLGPKIHPRIRSHLLRISRDKSPLCLDASGQATSSKAYGTKRRAALPKAWRSPLGHAWRPTIRARTIIPLTKRQAVIRCIGQSRERDFRRLRCRAANSKLVIKRPSAGAELGDWVLRHAAL